VSARPLVLVTGASGFVGSHLLRRLVAHGRPVRALRCRAQSGNSSPDPGVEWLEADLTTADPAVFARGVECAYHLAALSLFTGTDADAARMEQLNVQAALRLARACKQSGVRQFVFVSSIAAGEVAESTEVDEDNGQPVSEYGRSKWRAEQALRPLSDADFSVTILRPSALFGEYHHGSVCDMARAIQRGRFALIGRGDNRVNFYYIDDFIDVLLAVAGDPRSYARTFIAADEPQPLREFVAAAAAQLRPGWRVPTVPRSLGWAIATGCDLLAPLVRRALPLSRRRVRAMTRDVAYLNHRLATSLGLQPRVGWRTGLERSIAWYRASGAL
jgi:nucleoside-diphosphate-sugar epimerase